MNRKAFIKSVLLTLLSISHGIEAEQPRWEVERLCGRLQLATKKVGKTSSAEQTKGIRKARVVLYRADNTTACCSAKDFVASTTTGLGGRFSFAALHPGDYWLGTSYQGKDYVHQLRILPRSDPDVRCGDHLFDLHPDGRFDMAVVITVD